MTRFLSSLTAVLGFLALAGCATPAGVSAPSIAEPAIAAAYIPLHKSTHFGLESEEAAAMVIAPGTAVTCAHNANLIDPNSVIGTASLSDLMFFRVAHGMAPPFAAPAVGAKVTTYGQNDGLRTATGTIRRLAMVPGYAKPAWFEFAANAGPGFSGGPVTDAQGRLEGIVFAYDDRGQKRLMLAYDMERVMAEFAGLAKRAN